jgi:transposase
MDNPLWSSPPRDSENAPWKTPPRKTVRVLARQGKSDREIFHETGIPRSTVQRIRRQETSRRMHRTRPNYPRMMTTREIRRALRFIATSYTTRCLTFERVRSILGITASVRTIRRELRKLGYRRCVSCPRPFISRA